MEKTQLTSPNLFKIFPQLERAYLIVLLSERTKYEIYIELRAAKNYTNRNEAIRQIYSLLNFDRDFGFMEGDINLGIELHMPTLDTLISASNETMDLEHMLIGYPAEIHALPEFKYTGTMRQLMNKYLQTYDLSYPEDQDVIIIAQHIAILDKKSIVDDVCLAEALHYRINFIAPPSHNENDKSYHALLNIIKHISPSDYRKAFVMLVKNFLDEEAHS